MATEIEHKVIIKEEALYDYEYLFAIPNSNWQRDFEWVKEHFNEPEYLNPIMPKEDIVEKCEEYLTLNNSLKYRHYFRAKYYDESKDRMLMLFFYKGEKIVVVRQGEETPVQLWVLKGICLSEDWTQDLEDSGAIRNWLKREIQVEEQEDDWVWVERIRERERQLELAREGYLEMEDNMAIVKELLDGYKTNKAKLAVMDKTPEMALLEKQMDYLDNCVKTLDAEEQLLFMEVYVKKNSVRKLGRKYGYCKSTMYNRLHCLVAKLEILFNGKTW